MQRKKSRCEILLLLMFHGALLYHTSILYLLRCDRDRSMVAGDCSSSSSSRRRRNSSSSSFHLLLRQHHPEHRPVRHCHRSHHGALTTQAEAEVRRLHLHQHRRRRHAEAGGAHRHRLHLELQGPEVLDGLLQHRRLVDLRPKNTHFLFRRHVSIVARPAGREGTLLQLGMSSCRARIFSLIRSRLLCNSSIRS
jgi:hypothetical protein